MRRFAPLLCSLLTLPLLSWGQAIGYGPNPTAARTYYVRASGGSDANPCTSANSACATLQGAADKALKFTPFVKSPVRVVLLPTYTTASFDPYAASNTQATYAGSAGTMDLWFQPMEGGSQNPSYVEVSSYPVRSTDLVNPNDGGTSLPTGTCTWSDGSPPARSTCGSTSTAYTTNDLQGRWVRLGNVSAAYPDGVCGTWPVQSNTSSTITLEFVAESASMGYGSSPSACTGSIPYAIVEPGAKVTGTVTMANVNAWPPFAYGLPDAGAYDGESLNAAKEVAGSSAYTWQVQSSGRAGAGSFSARWIDFLTASSSNLLLGRDTDATVQTSRFKPVHVSGSAITTMGGGRITFNRNVLKPAAASAMVAVKSYEHTRIPFIRGLYNWGNQVTWLNLASVADSLLWYGNYITNPDGSAYSAEAISNGFIGADILANMSTSGTGTVLYRRQDGFIGTSKSELSSFPLWSLTVDRVNWTGTNGATGQTGCGVLCTNGNAQIDIDPSGTASVINLPEVTKGIVNVSRNTNASFRAPITSMSTGDAGVVATFGTAASTTRTWADFDAGSPQNVLCDKAFPHDGCASISGIAQ